MVKKKKRTSGGIGGGWATWAWREGQWSAACHVTYDVCVAHTYIMTTYAYIHTYIHTYVCKFIFKKEEEINKRKAQKQVEERKEKIMGCIKEIKNKKTYWSSKNI